MPTHTRRATTRTDGTPVKAATVHTRGRAAPRPGPSPAQQLRLNSAALAQVEALDDESGDLQSATDEALAARWQDGWAQGCMAETERGALQLPAPPKGLDRAEAQAWQDGLDQAAEARRQEALEWEPAPRGRRAGVDEGVTFSCPECGEDVTSSARGAGTAACWNCNWRSDQREFGPRPSDAYRYTRDRIRVASTPADDAGDPF